MKKSLAVMIAVIISAASLSLTACAAKISEVSISIDYGDFADVGEFVYNAESKYISQTIQGTFGAEFSLDDVQVWCKRTDGKSNEVMDGYEIEGVLPEPLGVGEHKLTFKYEGWTNDLIIRVEKRIVSVPGVAYDEENQEYKQYTYNGSPQTVDIQVDPDAKYYTMVNPQSMTQTNAGTYGIEFELKDKTNTAWYSIDTNGNYVTDNYVMDWVIQKKKLTFGEEVFALESLIGGTYDAATNTFTFAHDGTPKALPLRGSAIDTQLVRVRYYANGELGSQYLTAAPTDAGRYEVYIALNAGKADNYELVGGSTFGGTVDTPIVRLAILVIE